MLVALALAAPGSAAERQLNPSAGDATIRLDDSNGSLRKNLDVEKGKSVVIQTTYSVKRVSVGNPDIADVVVLSPRELNLVAKDIGDTNVVLWGPSGRAEAALELSVVRPYARIEKEMREVLGGEDVHIEGVGDSIVLKGNVTSTSAAERALRVARAFFPEKEDEGRIINLLEVGGNQQVMIDVTIAEVLARPFRSEI